MARPAAAALRVAKLAAAPAGRAAPVLLLPPATGELPEAGGVTLACNAAPQRKAMEHCGHAYHSLVRRASGLDMAGDADVDKRGRGEDVEGAEAAAAAARAEENGDAEGEHAGTRLKKMLSKDSDDLYDLMGLGDLRWRATGDEIKKAFRKASLMYHPDKVCHLGEEALADSETHFKAVKKAYEILSDKKKRASYDSIDDVDDSFPAEASLNDGNFFDKMRPVFELNARWSSANRVPPLGDAGTSTEEVNKFYDFWYSFKTWRDFSFDLEYDTDQADCREEKRWMDRQNQKHIKTRKLEEASRIRKLVDVAYKRDPRVRRERVQAKEKKEAARQERLREREAAAEAELAAVAAKREEDEKAAAEQKEERASAKKVKEANRQLTRRARQRLRTVAKDLGFSGREDLSIAVERCCGELSAAEIEAVASRVEEQTPPTSAASALRLIMAAIEGACAAAPVPATVPAPAPVPARAPVANKPAESVAPVEWTPDEMKRLTKALAKCPVGTVDRYQKLADYVGTRDAEQCLAMVNAKRARHVAAATSSAVSGQRPPAVAVAPMGSDFERFERERKKCDIASKEVPPTMTADASAAPMAEQRPNGSAAAASRTPPTNGAAAAARGKPPNTAGFTPKQQAQLEAAMKKHPVSLGGARWALIAGDVSGRSGEECEVRFKELVSFYKAKKAGVK